MIIGDIDFLVRKNRFNYSMKRSDTVKIA